MRRDTSPTSRRAASCVTCSPISPPGPGACAGRDGASMKQRGSGTTIDRGLVRRPREDDADDKLASLREAAIFADLAPAILSRLAEAGRLIEVKEGTVLFEQ